MKKTLWKNNVNFAKDVTMIHVNFILITFIVPKKKVGDISFVPILV